MPWTEGTHRVVRETTELVGGLVDEVEEDRLEREAQERHVKRMQIMGDGAFGGLRADWVLGGVAATAPPREADLLQNEPSLFFAPKQFRPMCCRLGGCFLRV